MQNHPTQLDQLDLPIPLEVLVSLCIHLRQQYPDPKKCTWPAYYTENIAHRWEQIAQSYGEALDPDLPWMEEFEGEKTLLRAALQAHTWGPAADEFPSAIHINQAARSMWKAHQDEVAKLSRQMAPEPQGGSDVRWKCTRLLAYKFGRDPDPVNPYANRLDEVLAWAEQQGINTDKISSTAPMRIGAALPL